MFLLTVIDLKFVHCKCQKREIANEIMKQLRTRTATKEGIQDDFRSVTAEMFS